MSSKRKAVCLDSEKRDSVSPDSVKRDSVSPDSEGRDSVSPDEEKRDSVSPDEEKMDSVSPDSEGRDSVSPDEGKRDSVSPDEEKRDSASRKPDSRWMINESDSSDKESDSDSDYDAKMKDFFPEHPLETKQYFEETKAYEGYYVSGLENVDVWNPVLRADTTDDPEFEVELRSATEFAVSEYNKEKKTSLGVKQLVRANLMGLHGNMYFLTFEASDECFYEAKVWSVFPTGFKFMMMRPALYYPARNESYTPLVWVNNDPN